MLCHLWQSAAQSCNRVSDTNEYLINLENLPVAYFCLLIFLSCGEIFGNAVFKIVLLCCWVLGEFKERPQKKNGWNGFSLYAVTLPDVEVATDGRRSIRDFRFPQLSRLSRQVVTRLKGAGSGGRGGQDEIDSVIEGWSDRPRWMGHCVFC